MGAHRRIGGIQPFAELAQGRATVVYKGYEAAHDRFVLLKVLRAEASLDAALVARFEEEAHLAAQIAHPNVVEIYDSGRDGAHVYLAAAFVEGGDLGALLAAHGPLPPVLAAYIMREAARGLEAAHRRGILHRDLKPSNLLVGLDGIVRLTDFGLASAVEAEGLAAEVRGTPAYLAPELVRGAAPTAAADLFSLGATFYEILAGRPAFARPTTPAVLDALLHDDPLPRLLRRAEIPAPLADICGRLLAKDPAARYPDASALVADLDAACTALGLDDGAETLRRFQEDPAGFSAPPIPPRAEAPAAPPARRRGRRVLAWSLLVGLLVLSGGLLLAETQRPATRPPPESEALAATRSAPTVGPRDEPPGTPLVPQEEPPALEPADDPAEIEPADEEDIQDEAAEPEPALESVPVLPEDPPTATAPAEPEPTTGALDIVCAPWCDVFRGDERLGTSPPLEVELPAGTHRLVLRNPAFPERTETVTLAGGERQALRVSLWEQVARVAFDVRPWAEVIVADTVWAEVPFETRPLVLRPGTHRLRLRRRTATWDTTLSVRPGTRHLVRHYFELPPR